MQQTIELKCDVKSKASTAKKRICSGLWNNPNDKQITSEQRIYLNTRRYVLNNLPLSLIEKGNVEMFFNDAYKIVTSSDNITNPIGKLLISYGNIDFSERYIFKLSKAYIFVKNAYFTMKNIEYNVF